MQLYPVALSAGIPKTLAVPGDFFHIFAAADPLEIGFDEGKRDAVEKGVGARVYYERIELYSATSQTVRVYLGFGYVTDSRASVNATINTTIAPANTNTQLAEVSVPAGGSAKIADANADRKELRVSIKSTETGGVYLGDATIANNEGGWLEAGMVDYIATQAETWAFNPGAAAVIVSALDLERP
jgi:hypothetical protein